MTALLVLRPATPSTPPTSAASPRSTARAAGGRRPASRYAGGDVRAALVVDTGRAVADPFFPSAEPVSCSALPPTGDRPRRLLRAAPPRFRRPALAVATAS